MFHCSSTNHSKSELHSGHGFASKGKAHGLETFPTYSLDSTIRGTGSSDYLVSGARDSKLYGFAGDDTLIGGRGNDLLNGGTGKNRLFGGKGKDILVDEDGGDIMVGGLGSDQFNINFWSGPDTPSTIVDFKVGTDKIKIARLGVTYNHLKIQDSSGGAVIREGDKTIAFVLNVRASKLKADSFLFGDPELAKQLQASLEQTRKTTGVIGVTNAVVTPDGYTWQGAAGVADLKSQTPMQVDNVFDIASISKAFTATTVLKVVEAGKISLDDTLRQWLPQIASNIPNSENMTLRQLLDGSGGIYNYTESEKYNSDVLDDYQNGFTRYFTPENSASYAYGQPRYSGLSSSSIWTYPNTGNVLAGLMLEKATGLSFSEVLRAEVLDPLGLKHTFIGRSEPIGSPRIAVVVARYGVERCKRLG